MAPSRKPAGAIPQIPLLGVTQEESFDSGEDRRSAYYRQQAWQHSHAQPPAAKPQPLLTIPNILTFLRLILVPVVFVLMYHPSIMAPIWAAHLFVLASLTDWLDGYLARKVRRRAAVRAWGRMRHRCSMAQLMLHRWPWMRLCPCS